MDSSPTNENCHHFLTLKLLKTCMDFFLLLDTRKKKILCVTKQLLGPIDFLSMERKKKNPMEVKMNDQLFGYTL